MKVESDKHEQRKKLRGLFLEKAKELRNGEVAARSGQARWAELTARSGQGRWRWRHGTTLPATERRASRSERERECLVSCTYSTSFQPSKEEEKEEGEDAEEGEEEGEVDAEEKEEEEGEEEEAGEEEDAVSFGSCTYSAFEKERRKGGGC